MIRKVVDFALNNRFVVLTAAILVTFAGTLAFHDLPSKLIRILPTIM